MRRIDRMVHGSLFSVRGFRPLAWLVVAAGCSLLSAASAQTGLKLQLVPESTAIVPGQSFRVGLFIQHDKGWHTYWRQPGIVGVPTTIRWTLPKGFTAGELEYPEPEATKMFHIKAQGYERDVLLQTQIQAPTDAKPGTKVTLKGRAAWMCCGNTCHPGTLELSITLPVAEESAPHPQWQPIFAKERAAYARASEAWSASAVEKGLNVTLTLRPTRASARRLQPREVPRLVFFTEDGWINSDQDQKANLATDGTLTMHLVRAEVFLGKGTPGKLLGIIQREGGWHEDGSLRSLTIQPQITR